MKINPNGIIIAYNFAKPDKALLYLLFHPNDWKDDLKPCKRCSINKTNETAYKAVLVIDSNLCTVSGK